MLLDFMRKNTRRFLIAITALIVPTFILWGGSVSSFSKKEDQSLAKVGRRKISLEEYGKYYQALREMTLANFRGSLTPEMEKTLNLKQQALDRLIRKTLLDQEVDRLKIVVSDEEVQASLKKNPAFIKDGKFDASKWNALLNDPQVNWPALIEQEREQMRLQKLMDMIAFSARVTDEEVRNEYLRQRETVKIRYVAIRASDFGAGLDVSGDELSRYYEQHKQEYAEPAQAKLSFVEIKKTANPMDYEEMRKHAQSVLEKARAGEDFAKLAETYSDDKASARKGGDLGFFGKGRMVKEFENVAFSLKPGEISDLVQTPFGYHIIKLEETKGSGDSKEVHARHILLKVDASEDTLISLEEQATQLSVEAGKSGSLERAAAGMKLSAQTTPLFAETMKAIPAIGYVPEIADIVPGLAQGKVSNVIETRTAYYVVQMTERIPERTPQLQEVEDKVRTALRLEKGMALARARAEEIVKEVNEKGLSLEKIPNLPKVAETAPFTRRGYPPEFPRMTGLADTVFDLQGGKAAGPFMSQNSAYVVEVAERISPDAAEYEAYKGPIKDRLLEERRGQVFEDYYENLKKKVGVQTNEEMFKTM
ncbi:SurA N-terminal domain-containing protein [Candidatus Poribacteria bacterium]|nr:SurA N-terminal domain-containing protein [Candidatus Poribacteria bacterium]